MQPEKKCRDCGDAAKRKVSKAWLCQKHARILSMRYSANAAGKRSPTKEALEAMVSALDEFRCPHCKVEMTWSMAESPARVLSLQHDHSGEIRLLCLQCNGRHAQFPEDGFYSRPPNLHHCFICGQWKDASEFYPKKAGKAGRKSHCKPCGNISRLAQKKAKRIRLQP